ncbi:hypothetical protein ACFL0W_04880 [Nanoarchaeota archaeon]
MSRRILPLIFIIILVFCSSIVLAQDVTLEITSINNKASFNDWAEYYVELTNEKLEQDVFLVSSSEEGSLFSLLSDPTAILTSGIRLNGSGKISAKLLVKPKDTLVPNPKRPYTFMLDAISKKTGEKVSASFDLFVLETPPEKPKELIYDTDVDISVKIPEQIDPRAKYSVKIILKKQQSQGSKESFC